MRIRQIVQYPDALIPVALFLLWSFLSNNSADPDLFHRLATGRLVEALGSISFQDPFAFTPRHSIWIDHEWLSAVWFYRLFLIYGWEGLFVFKLLASLASIVFFCRAQQVLAGNRSSSIFWVLCLTLGSLYLWQSTVRSQVFTYLFLAILFYLLAAFERRHVRLALSVLPLMFFAWSQCHGGFVVGLGYVALYSLALLCLRDERWPFVALVAIGSALATLVSPYGGILYWQYVFDAVTMSRATIPEWDAVTLLDPGNLLSLMFFVGAVIAFLRADLRSRALMAVFILPALYYGLKHQRLSALLLMAIFVWASPGLSALLEGLYSKLGRLAQPLRHSAAIVLVLGSLYFAADSVRMLQNKGIVAHFERYPVGAVSWLENSGAGGNLLIDFNYGSYALWELYPNYLVSIDGRYEETYPQSTLDLVNRALYPHLPDHLEALQSISADYVLLEYEKVLSPVLLDQNWPGYAIVYSDGNFAVLEAVGRI